MVSAPAPRFCRSAYQPAPKFPPVPAWPIDAAIGEPLLKVTNWPLLASKIVSVVVVRALTDSLVVKAIECPVVSNVNAPTHCEPS